MIVASKVQGVRVSLCASNFHGEFARRHNNLNAICFGQTVSSSEQVLNMINIFFNTGFDAVGMKIALIKFYRKVAIILIRC